MKFIKIISLAIAAPLFLSACGGSDESENGGAPAEPGEKIYDGGDFTISYPQDWEVLEPAQYPSTVPAQTVIAFRNNIRNEIFTANLNVSISSVDENISAEDFVKSTLAKMKKNLLEFKQFQIEDANMIEFEGKKSASEPIVHFKGLGFVQNQSAYMIGGAYLPNEEESTVNSIDEMLSSFTLK